MDPTNRNTALASAMVEELARCGVCRAVVSPGSRSTPLALALWREPAIEANVIVDERSAGFFALGAAQASGLPVAVLCTSGTAAANLMPAVAEADQSAVPLIVLTADRPPELRDIGAGQTIDQLKLYGSAVRWFCEVGTHEADDAGLLHFRAVSCRAFALAAGDSRPGPVHLNVPFRDPLGPEPRPDDVTAENPLALAGRDDRPLTTVPRPPQEPAPALADAVADQIDANPRGLIVAGRMPETDAAAIAELAGRCGYPILAEPTSGLRLGPHDRDLVVATYDAIARSRPARLAPDLILRLGEMPTSKPLRQWLSALPGTTQLVIDPLGAWNEPTRMAGAIMRAEPGALARSLTARIARGPERAWIEAWLQADRAVAEALGSALDGTAASEPALQLALADAYRDGDLVYTASSMPIRDQEAFLPSGPADVRFLANRGANGIDGLVSSGIGAATASGRPTWIVTGDLGLHHDSNALACLRHCEAPVRIIVVNNDGGGIFGFLPQADQLDRAEYEGLLGTPAGLDPQRLASLHGVEHVLLDRPAGLGELGDRTVVAELRVDRAANVELHRGLAATATDAVAAALGD